jgi:hypothetical protein
MDNREKDIALCEDGFNPRPLAMVTMSEAAWDRNEERHRKEKRTLLIAFVAAVVVAVVTNIGWLLTI